MHLLSDSTESLGMKFLMRIYSIQLQRFKRPLRFGWWITTILDPMTPSVIKLQWSSCRGHIKQESLVLNCLPDGGDYEGAVRYLKLNFFRDD